MGRPDWRKPTDYPDPKSTRPDDWAWEFLRRNPLYRQAFADAVAAGKDEAIWELGAKWGLTFGAADPDEGNTPLVQVYIDSFPGPGRMVKIAPIASFQSTSVAWLEPLHPDFATDGSPSLAPIVWEPKHHNQVAIIFDLNWSIKAQLKEANDILSRKRTAPSIKQIERARGAKFSGPMRKSVSKFVSWQTQHNMRRGLKKRHLLRLDKFQTYLRMLDAEASGATIDQMLAAGNLIPLQSDRREREAAKRWLAKARQLRDGGYRDIVGRSDG